MDNSFGERLKALREAKGWTQGELAERAGTKTNSVSRLELGRYVPTWPTVLALAKALGLSSLDEFLPATGQATPKKATRKKST
jgi:transcriptional regulator with XRE-family HTH domain